MTTSTLQKDQHKNYWNSSNGRCDSRSLDDPWRRSGDVFDLPRPKNFAMPFSSVLKQAEQLSLFVDIDPDILGGTPRIEGTRIPVYMVLNAIDEHGSVMGAANAYRSSIKEEEVRDALRFAVHVLESPIEYKSAHLDR